MCVRRRRRRRRRGNGGAILIPFHVGRPSLCVWCGGRSLGLKRNVDLVNCSISPGKRREKSRKARKYTPE